MSHNDNVKSKLANELIKNPTILESLQDRLVQILGDPAKIPKNELLPEKDTDGKGSYWVEDPAFNYRGKSYSEWVTEWFNWFLSADADKRIFGPMVFLRSKGLPSISSGAYMPDVPGQPIGGEYPGAVSSDPGYLGVRTYVNDANVKVGGDRLQIFENQAVLCPIIVGYELVPPSRDWGTLHEFIGSLIDNGDNPPSENQLTINSKNVKLPAGRKMEDFRIATPIFTAIVPDVEFGRSVKDFLETPTPTGNYPAMVEGYFVILRFTEGHYWVHSWASGPRETAGPYFSELIYQIEVKKPKRGTGVRTAYRPARNERLLARILADKKKGEDLDDKQIRRLKKYTNFSIT